MDVRGEPASFFAVDLMVSNFLLFDPALDLNKGGIVEKKVVLLALWRVCELCCV